MEVLNILAPPFHAKKERREKERKSIFRSRFIVKFRIANLLSLSKVNLESILTLFFSIRLQSPRNGEDLSDGEQELETGIRESSPEGSVTGQVRVKVKKTPFN